MFRKSAQPTKPTDRAVITDAGPCQKSLRLHVDMAVIAPIRSAVLQEFQKQASLPGFRKGKAPVELVEKHFGQSVQDETLHRVTKQAFEQAVREHGLKPVGPFEVRRADYRDGEGLTLEATVEVEPEFALVSYHGIPLTRGPDDITQEEIGQALVKLQDSMAQMVPAPARHSLEPGRAPSGPSSSEVLPAPARSPPA